jgi:hypothetical protein
MDLKNAVAIAQKGLPKPFTMDALGEYFTAKDLLIEVILLQHPRLLDVLLERERQITVKGWNLSRDDEHAVGELAEAAACYAHTAFGVAFIAHQQGLPEEDRCVNLSEVPAPDKWGPPEGRDESLDLSWPWIPMAWKPASSSRRNLVKAGALIQAELERMDRVDAKKSEVGDEF